MLTCEKPASLSRSSIRGRRRGTCPPWRRGSGAGMRWRCARRVRAAGELARRAGVSASALRYYEELGLLPPPARISGQRRYDESAARIVAAILLYSDAGFTLAEQKTLMAGRASTPGDRRQLMRRKLAELDEQIARAQAVREAISHGLRCPHEDITQCPNFNAGITARLAGQPLSRSHQQLHGQRFHDSLTQT